MKIKDAVANLAMDMQRCADGCLREAKDEAYVALDGDLAARERSIRWAARSKVYAEVVKNLDNLRISIENGEAS